MISWDVEPVFGEMAFFFGRNGVLIRLIAER
jgi:hypothetical protein